MGGLRRTAGNRHTRGLTPGLKNDSAGNVEAVGQYLAHDLLIAVVSNTSLRTVQRTAVFLFDREVAHKNERSLETASKIAHFPAALLLRLPGIGKI